MQYAKAAEIAKLKEKARKPHTDWPLGEKPCTELGPKVNIPSGRLWYESVNQQVLVDQQVFVIYVMGPTVECLVPLFHNKVEPTPLTPNLILGLTNQTGRSQAPSPSDLDTFLHKHGTFHRSFHLSARSYTWVPNN